MSLMATDVIKPAFEKTKKLLLPFKFWIWIKLGLLAILAGGASGGNFNFNMPGGNSGASMDALNLSNITSNLHFWVIGLIIAFMVLLLIIILIKSFFKFGFIKSIDTEKVYVLKHLKTIAKQGGSYFWVNILMFIIFLVILGLFIVPFLAMLGLGSTSVIPGILGLFFLFLLVAFIFALVYSFIDSFVVFFMYLKNQKAWLSIKACWKLFRKNFKEMFLFWLIKIGFNIAGGIIILFAMIIILLVLLLIGGLFAALVYGLYLAVGMVVAIILGVILGLIFLVIFIATMILLSAPISVYMASFNLLFMKKFLQKARK